MSRQDLLSKNGNKCWPNGSLRTDSSQNLQICCNFRNLPSAFIVGSMTAPSAEVTYLWDGTKVKTSSALGHGRLYKGSFVYSVSPTGTQLESISHDEGRILAAEGASGTEFIDTWHVRDYLGSVRAVYDISTPANEVEDASEHVLEQSDYYAFGNRIDTPGQTFDQTNRYRYNGKEQLRFESLNLDPGLTDYGARYYAPAFGRWTSPDPLADKYYSVSPYAFCNNNPVNFIDPDGAAIETLWDVASVGLGVRSLIKNARSGNVRAAIGDGFGIAVDVAAAALPFVPSGVGSARAVGKGVVNFTENVVEVAKKVDTAKDAGKATANSKTYATYIKKNLETKEIYSGRTSGYGAPEDIVRKRDNNHHKNKDGFEAAELDKSSHNPDAIRGREQYLIDQNGGAKSNGGTSGTP